MGATESKNQTTLLGNLTLGAADHVAPVPWAHAWARGRAHDLPAGPVRAQGKSWARPRAQAWAHGTGAPAGHALANPPQIADPIFQL